MGGIATNVIYIASSLAAGSQPTTATVDQPVTITIAAAAAPLNEPPTPSASRGYVILDVPKPATLLLGDVIADEMKRSRDDYARTAAMPETPKRYDFSVGGVQAVSAPGELNDAVVAAHEARIALLRGRIDSLKAAGAAAPDARLHDLAMRLKRAEAARKLATARIALGEQPRDCDPRGGLLPCSDDREAAAPGGPRHHAAARETAGQTLSDSLAPAAGKPRLVEGARARLRRNVMTAAAAPPLRGASFNRLPPAVTRSVRYLTKASTRGARLRGTARAAFAARPTPAAHAALNPRVAERLDRARHLLTVARRSLEATGADRQYAATRLANLWQWPGSDNWSLANYPRRSV